MVVWHNFEEEYMFYWIKISENLGIDFSRFENVRNYKHETDHMIPIIKKILLFLITFLSKTKKIMINKIINRLNTIDSPNTHKYFVFFRFSCSHEEAKLP